MPSRSISGVSQTLLAARSEIFSSNVSCSHNDLSSVSDGSRDVFDGWVAILCPVCVAVVLAGECRLPDRDYGEEVQLDHGREGVQHLMAGTASTFHFASTGVSLSNQ